MPKKIADVLKTEHFQNIYHEALMGLMVVSGQQVYKQQRFFKQYGLTTQQYNVLRIVRGQYPLSCNLNLVKERLMDKTSDVSRLVERLRRMGLVSRIVNKDDRRAVEIRITEEGLTLLKGLDAEIPQLWDLGHISEADAQSLIALIEKIIE